MKRLLLLLALLLPTQASAQCESPISTGLAFYYLTASDVFTPGKPWQYYDAVIASPNSNLDTLTTFQKPGSKVFAYVHLGFINKNSASANWVALRDTHFTDDTDYFLDGSNNRVIFTYGTAEYYHLRYTTANADTLSQWMQDNLSGWDTTSKGFYFDECYGDDSTATPVHAEVPDHRLTNLQVTPSEWTTERQNFKVFRDQMIDNTAAWTSNAFVIANVGKEMFFDTDLNGITVEYQHMDEEGNPDDVVAAFALYTDGWNVCWNCIAPNSLFGCSYGDCGIQFAARLGRAPDLDF